MEALEGSLANELRARCWPERGALSALCAVIGSRVAQSPSSFLWASRAFREAGSWSC